MIQSVAKIDPSRLERELNGLNPERDNAERLADYIGRQIGKAIALQGSASIAFSGGSTPVQMMRALARKDLDWQSVTITLVDERCVSPDDERSNARLITQNLLDNLDTKPNFLPLFLEGEEEFDCAERLSAIPRPFDLVHLGMGEDAHTASFFPDADNIGEMIDPSGSNALARTCSVSSREQRITWTLPSLIDARSIVLQINGEAKKEVFLNACSELSLASNQEQIDAVNRRLPITALLHGREVSVASETQNSTDLDCPFLIYCG